MSWFLVFSAWRYVSAAYATARRLSVQPFLCLSHAGVVSKWLNAVIAVWQPEILIIIHWSPPNGSAKCMWYKKIRLSTSNPPRGPPYPYYVLTLRVGYMITDSSALFYRWRSRLLKLNGSTAERGANYHMMLLHRISRRLICVLIVNDRAIRARRYVC